MVSLLLGTGVQHEEWPDPLRQVEPYGIVRPVGILMADIVKKREVQLVSIVVAGLSRLCMKLRPRSTGHGGDWSRFKIEGVQIQQDLSLDLRDLVEIGRIEW